MRAVYYLEKGEARDVLRIGEIETPEPSPGEVRVKLAVSGINPSDVRARSGIYPRPVDYSMIIPHNDGAGIIDKVGPGVPESLICQRVWTFNAQFMRPFGTAAEYVVIPANLAAPLPDNTDFASGACLGVPALTAYYGVTLFGPVNGMTVLVTGGAGAVGHYAVQIAKEMGATVVATVSSEEKASHARSGGADHIINYRTENVANRIKELTGGKGVDRIVEVNISANGPVYADILARRAKVAVYGSGEVNMTLPARPFIGLIMPTIEFYNVYQLNAESTQPAIEYIVRMMRTGRLLHTVSRRYKLDEIVSAHEAVESGEVIGNVVVDIACLE